MLKKSAKLRVTCRSPIIYNADLRMLEQENSYEQNQALNFESHQRMPNQDARMNMKKRKNKRKLKLKKFIYENTFSIFLLFLIDLL